MIARIKKSLTSVPTTFAEAVTYLTSIGEKQREINRIKRETKAKVKEINDKANEEISVLSQDRNNFFVALFAFASPRKASLTYEVRTQVTSSGTFGWRWTPPAVELAEGVSDQEVIDRLKARGLTQYVRTVEELNREEMLKGRPVVKGVAYTQRDEFFAKPKMAKADGCAEELVKITETIDA